MRRWSQSGSSGAHKGNVCRVSSECKQYTDSAVNLAARSGRVLMMVEREDKGYMQKQRRISLNILGLPSFLSNQGLQCTRHCLLMSGLMTVVCFPAQCDGSNICFPVQTKARGHCTMACRGLRSSGALYYEYPLIISLQAELFLQPFRALG